jgi:hypothetical protein
MLVGSQEGPVGLGRQVEPLPFWPQEPRTEDERQVSSCLISKFAGKCKNRSTKGIMKIEHLLGPKTEARYGDDARRYWEQRRWVRYYRT